ncbi:MAG: hypothetical protein BWX53_00025 [Parcubacteria group bacterium ADurb.Bin016]|nr:MAG: hypothetical protein BWX53_00025 [Parcubacteria group bacterium ADurb.Bin016]
MGFCDPFYVASSIATIDRNVRLFLWVIFFIPYHNNCGDNN